VYFTKFEGESLMKKDSSPEKGKNISRQRSKKFSDFKFED